METYTSIRQQIVEWAEVFPWAEGKNYTEVIYGHRRRKKAIEHNLPILERDGLLESTWWGQKKVYRLGGSKRKIRREEIPHDLMCTRIALDFKACRDWSFVSERFLKAMGFKSIPEWLAIKNGKGVALEYSTADNFRRVKEMKGKVFGYEKEIDKYERYFDAYLVVLFIFDVPRWKVKHFAQKYGANPFTYFIDLATFTDIPKGELLDKTNRFFFLARDGKEYPLT